MFKLQGIYDSNYAEDKENGTGVFGYIVYYSRAPVAWKSNSGNAICYRLRMQIFLLSREFGKCWN